MSDPNSEVGPTGQTQSGTTASVKDKAGDPKKKAEKVEPKKAEKVSDEVAQQRAEADGDVRARDKAYREPEGTVHTDQFNTAFPSEKNTVRKG